MMQKLSIIALCIAAILCTVLCNGTNYPLTAAQKKTIVDYHNKLRAQVKPPAANMKTMVWDNALEKIATDWSVQCQGDRLMSHNAGRSSTYSTYVGENIYGTTGNIQNKNLEDAIQLWDDEKEFYDFDTKSCKSGEVCGHYTQVVWANSDKIGCAITQCTNLQYGGTLICNYAPGGNYNNQYPYEKASSASATRYTSSIVLACIFACLVSLL